jgi:hypothetical protein
VIGFGILWEATPLQQVADLPSVGVMPCGWRRHAALKEVLFVIFCAWRIAALAHAGGQRLARADAAPALVVVVGIAGALMGWKFLDLLAAAIMAS